MILFIVMKAMKSSSFHIFLVFFLFLEVYLKYLDSWSFCYFMWILEFSMTSFYNRYKTDMIVFYKHHGNIVLGVHRIQYHREQGVPALFWLQPTR